MGRTAIVDWARAIYEDLDFTTVTDWLAAHPGQHACGYLPVYAPREVIHAAGMLPVGIHGSGAVEIIRGDAFYQSYICHLPRSIIELAQSGRLDMLSAVLFPSTCDVIRNLSGMWQLLKPGMYVRYVDLPQDFDPQVGGRFWEGELRHLLADLCKISGRDPDSVDLAASIRLYDQARARVRALYELRRRAPWTAPTEEIYLLMRAGEQQPVEQFIETVDAYLLAAAAEPGRSRDQTRVIVVGAFCEQPPLGLIKTIERAGCAIVDDDFLVGNRLLSQPVGPRLDRGVDPVTALALALCEDSLASPILYEPDPTGKARLMGERVAAAGADGIVFAAPSFCDPALLDRPMLRAGAEALGIPCIAFQYSENTGQFQQFREQAGTFADAIKLWGGSASSSSSPSATPETRP